MTAIQSETGRERGVWPAIGWGCYVGSGWTWIIGMVLPALLLRDYGVWGWFGFAVPNVLGAMAMGYVLTARSSERVAGRHLDMGLRFSAVTIAYHGFVMGWLYPALLGWWSLPVILLLMAAAWGAVRPGGGAKAVAVGVSVVSLAVLGYLQTLPTAWEGVAFDAPTRLSEQDLWLFIPASALGFVLCPYLDLTFHRARQSAEGATGRMAFALGFGVVFLLMIAGSLMYSGVVLDGIGGVNTVPAVALVLGVHLVVQTAFTLAIHVREGTRLATGYAWWRMGLVLVLGVLAGVAVRGEGMLHGLSAGEVGYRVFLLAYGLPFPAYVWLCVIPTLRQGIPPRAKVIVWAIATLLALPPTYAAFVAAWHWGIPITIGLLVLARGVVELLPRDPGTIAGRAEGRGTPGIPGEPAR